MICKIFSPNNLAKIMSVFAQTTASFCKNLLMLITSFFEKNAYFFAKKLAKIAKYCDHNMDCWCHIGIPAQKLEHCIPRREL
jgi:hypothetical protein